MPSLYLPELHAHLRYIELPGQAPVRVYLHGLCASSTADFPYAATAPGVIGHRSLLVDLLGFGYSDRPERFGYTLTDHTEVVIRLLDHLGLSGCEVIGHSLGGTIAITLAALRPDLVSRLVVAEGNLDPGGGALSRSIASQTEAEYVARGHAALLVRTAAEAVDSPAAAAFLGTAQLAAPHAIHRSACSIVAGTQPAARERLLALPMPRRFLYGEKNLPHPNVERLQAAGIPVLVVPGTGHAMMDENPKGFAQTIAQALN